MSTQLEKDVVILGGGISGLAAAYRLHRAGLDVLLLEKSEKPGGAIQSEQVDGFLIDYGPNSTLDTSPKIGEFVNELGLEERRVNANAEANRRYILRGGHLYPLPMNPPQFLKTKLFSTRAKLRLLREPFIPAAPQDKEESIAEFVERRLGREFLDYAIDPFVAGVYAGNPETLSVRSAVRKVFELESKYGSLIKGMVKGAYERKKRTEIERTKAQLFSFRNGMAELTQAITSKLAEAIHTGAQVESVNLPSEFDEHYKVLYVRAGESVTVVTKSLVFATPAFVTARLMKSLEPTIAAELEKITYPPVAVIYLGYKRPVKCRPLDGFGFLVPKVENRRILGTIWSSTIFPNRAPEGGAALTAFVGGMRQPELTELGEHKLIDIVLDELGDILGLEGAPTIVRVKKWKKAIPQYEIGHQNRIDVIERFESEHPGLFLSGNFRNGISVGDCIVQSGGVARKVSEFCKHLNRKGVSV